MPYHIHEHYFNPNFNIGKDSVFTQVNDNYKPPPTPVEGYFLYLAGPPFTLLNGQNLALL